MSLCWPILPYYYHELNVNTNKSIDASLTYLVKAGGGIHQHLIT